MLLLRSDSDEMFSQIPTLQDLRRTALGISWSALIPLSKGSITDRYNVAVLTGEPHRVSMFQTKEVDAMRSYLMSYGQCISF